jgi:hypothetical protein
MVLTYRPGDAVPHPGVYAIIHGNPHTQYRELFVDKGMFPLCHTCGEHVVFRLIRAVENISRDADFGPDDPVAIRRTA